MSYSKTSRSIATWALTLVGLTVLTGLSSPGQNGPGASWRGGACPACGRGSTGAAAAQPLTDAELQSLLLMREEEKLARDVYVSFYRTWKRNVFANIARSEQRHFEAVGALLSRYSVNDPAVEQAGVFTSAALQTLYDQLAAKGAISLQDALEAGVAIEERDVEDLEAAIVATKKADIKRVYTNLLRGSLNHLAAFTYNLEAAAAKP